MNTYIYQKQDPFYTEESNQNIDYIVRNMPDVTVIFENDLLVQIAVDDKAEKILLWLEECDMIALYTQDVEYIMEVIQS